eukprot:748959-Amphidinium_carterae.1
MSGPRTIGGAHSACDVHSANAKGLRIAARISTHSGRLSGCPTDPSTLCILAVHWLRSTLGSVMGPSACAHHVGLSGSSSEQCSSAEALAVTPSEEQHLRHVCGIACRSSSGHAFCCQLTDLHFLSQTLS